MNRSDYARRILDVGTTAERLLPVQIALRRWPKQSPFVASSAFPIPAFDQCGRVRCARIGGWALCMPRIMSGARATLRTPLARSRGFPVMA
jgi:hypothetical protein